MKSLLSVNTDAKTRKGSKLGVLTGILYLAPANESGYNVCPMSTEGCRSACLFTAGRGGMDSVRNARVAKTLMFYEDRSAFLTMLVADVERLIRKADRDGLTPAVRLNGTSDIRWERIKLDNGQTLFERFPDVQFYDYTAYDPSVRFSQYPCPANYDVTYSLKETTESRAIADSILEGALPYRVAAVFDHGTDLPETYNGHQVVDGDVTDVRFNDPYGCYVGLRAKGKAKTDTSGFVLRELVESY